MQPVLFHASIIAPLPRLACGALSYRPCRADRARSAIVLWNTRYLDAALAQLRRDGYPVEDADVQRLSPLIHDHINLLGRYHFTNPDQDDGGQLRPLRDPRTTDD